MIDWSRKYNTKLKRLGVLESCFEIRFKTIKNIAFYNEIVFCFLYVLKQITRLIEIFINFLQQQSNNEILFIDDFEKLKNIALIHL